MIELEGSLSLNVDKGTPMLRPRGQYSPSETYIYDNNYRDYVWDEVILSGGSKATYYFVVRDRWDNVKGVKPIAGDTSSSRRWDDTKKAEFIAANSIVADMIQAGAITAEKLSSDFIFTKQIKIGPDASHVNFSVDARGRMNAVDGKFTGEIMANSGKIGGFDISSSRIGTVFSSTVEDDGMSLYNFAIKFKDTGKLAVLGTTTYPSSLAKATLLRLELNEYQPSIDNVLSFFDCRGASGNLGSRNIAIKVEAGDVDINGATYLWGNMFLGVQQASNNLAKSCFLFKGSMTITLPTPAYGRNQAVWFSGGSTGGYIRYSRDGETKELHLLADEGAMFVYGDTGWNVYSGKK